MNNQQWKEAMIIYHNRQNCLDKPEGRLDRHGRWLPYISEVCECCLNVDFPSVKNPNLLLDHCNTKSHCYHLVAKRNRFKERAERGVTLSG